MRGHEIGEWLENAGIDSVIAQNRFAGGQPAPHHFAEQHIEQPNIAIG